MLFQSSVSLRLGSIPARPLKRLVVVFAVCLLGGQVSGFADNLMMNGDFETGPFTTVGTVTGWTVTGNVADIAEGATSGSRSAALSAGADSEGDALAQTFVTTPNQRYTVDFDAGVFGERSGDPLQLNVQVIGSVGLVNDTVTPPDVSTFDASQVQFQHYQYTFVADTTQTTLRFSNIGLGNTFADVIVDTVVVAVAPLDYATWQAQDFTDSQQNDLSISGWNADPDKDGIPNALEYYFKFNPLAGITPAEAAAMPHVTRQQALTNVVTYRRRIGAGGTLQVSSDLQTWNDITNFVVQSTSTPTGDGVTEDVMVTWTGDPTKFFRVTLTPQQHPSSASRWNVSNGGNDHWYEVVQSPALNWAAARDYAVNRGGYLATITSSAENTFIAGLIPMGLEPYLGGYNENSAFHWVTAEPFTFTNWAAGEPDNLGGVEDRINMVHGDGTWNDTSHTDLNAFVVEYPQ